MNKSLKTMTTLAVLTCAQIALANYPGGKAPVTDVVQKSQPQYATVYTGPKLGQPSQDSEAMYGVAESKAPLSFTTICSFINQSLGRVLDTDIEKSVTAVAAAAKVKLSDLVVFATAHDDGTSEQVYYSLTNRKFYITRGFSQVSVAELAVPGRAGSKLNLQVFDVESGEKLELRGMTEAEGFMRDRLVPGASKRTASSAINCQAGNRGEWTMFRVKDPAPKAAPTAKPEESIFDRLKFFIPIGGA